MALCLFIESECRGLLHSGSPSGSGVGAPPSPPPLWPPPPPPGLSAEVKMDEIGDSDECTVGKMDERVTWGLDNRNGPQDPRSKW